MAALATLVNTNQAQTAPKPSVINHDAERKRDNANNAANNGKSAACADSWLIARPSRRVGGLWDFDDDSDYEFSDNDVRRIIIVTQTNVPFKGDRLRHEGYDRYVI